MVHNVKAYMIYDILYILLDRKSTREDPSLGGNVMKPMADPILNVTAYAWVLSGTFSLKEDILP